MKKMIIRIDRKNNGKFHSRDVRNYIGAIVDDEYKNLFMHHDRETSPFIYSKPAHNTIVVFSYKENNEALRHAAKKIMENKDLTLNGTIAKVISIEIKDTYYSTFDSGMYEYETRTPIIIGTQRSQKKEVVRLHEENEILEMIEFIRNSIIETIEVTTRQWFNSGVNLDNLMIMPKGAYKTAIICYKDDQYYPAVSMRFVSNVRLPAFIGYKIGLGYGELRHIKHEKSLNIKGSSND